MCYFLKISTHKINKQNNDKEKKSLPLKIEHSDNLENYPFLTTDITEIQLIVKELELAPLTLNPFQSK